MYCVKVPILNQCSAWLKTLVRQHVSPQVGEHTAEELKDINNQLYKFALKNILKT